ncbi:hypothetical protein POX_g08793 [Penicillium oxalicum]|uniref:Uncharacterized protein n=1 Tax=Penicillium oxalicum (strain 114-2 / CGMCC 5302) TaxID=933388 RepID=S8AY73_PENO1|nr:hypothetical protein POX_g08793 [Penicillium oxalicum]EPS26907.1 hypothetical protein PDE_01847 [Penicillium oxalicum 114-2]KAI2786408.1 hypothetical protein POX_g08793 [Penicillium oxalicum]
MSCQTQARWRPRKSPHGKYHYYSYDYYDYDYDYEYSNLSSNHPIPT